MSNSVIESINLACTVEPRDFSEEQRQYILNNESFRDELRFWWESRASDNCWTPANFNFIKSLYSTMDELHEKSNSLNYHQVIPFVLQDCGGEKDKLEGRVEVSSTGIELFFNGYGTSSMVTVQGVDKS